NPAHGAQYGRIARKAGRGTTMHPLSTVRAAAAVILAVVTTLVAMSAASAETFPTRPITLVVAYAPGGTGDLVARVVSDKLAAALGQPVVVENRAGAGGAIATRSVIAAPADGHTLLVGQTGEISITPHWNKAAGYDPDKDLQPVALATRVPLALVAPGNA